MEFVRSYEAIQFRESNDAPTNAESEFNIFFNKRKKWRTDVEESLKLKKDVSRM